MQKPKISVIIPVYNGEKTLRSCLSSVLCQDYENFEVIVVNNNSSDKTKDIILNLAKKDSRIKYLFEKEQKRGAARNTGEMKATGEIIAMTDADCIVPKDWISRIAEPLIKKECDGVQGFEENLIKNFWAINTQKQSEYFQEASTRKNSEFNHKNSAILKNAVGYIDTKNFAITRNALKKIGFTSRRYFSANDAELSVRFQKNNLALKFIKSIKVKHFHPDSFFKVARKSFKRAVWTEKINEDYKEFLKNNDFRERTNQTLWSFFKFFPGMAKTFVLEGPGYAYFDFISGMAWRAGLVYAWMGRINLKGGKSDAY